MRLDPTAHTARPWRIHQIAPDFRLEDVWALPTPGGADDFGRLVDAIGSLPFPEGAPSPVRFLWAARWRLGTWFGWDDADNAIGPEVASLRDRLDDDLRAAPVPAPLSGTPFTSVYLLPDEYAAEIANRTVHGVLHLGWVPDGGGAYRGQMAVLVKPNGRFGALYMTAIKPFRYLAVYPALLRAIERRWTADATTAS